MVKTAAVLSAFHYGYDNLEVPPSDCLHLQVQSFDELSSDLSRMGLFVDCSDANEFFTGNLSFTQCSTLGLQATANVRIDEKAARREVMEGIELVRHLESGEVFRRRDRYILKLDAMMQQYADAGGHTWD